MTRRFRFARRLGMLILPLALAVPAQALAQQQAPQAAPGADAGVAAGDISQAKLESYAAAVLKVQEIDRAWQPRIGQAQTREEAEIMATEATSEMIGEIEAQGLSVEEYNAITQAAEKDQQLYDRIMTLLAQAPR